MAKPLDLELMFAINEFSKLSGLKPATLRRLAPKMPDAINPTGTGWLFSLKSLEWIQNRPENRGKKREL